MGDASAYEALGLRPGAEQAEIERAYKRLIKEHHPDRAGGDARRAAEINRAYRELRPALAEVDPLELNHHLAEEPGSRFGWTVVALCVASALGGLLFAYTPMGESLGQWSPVSAHPLAVGQVGKGANDAMELPLATAAIDGAVSEARYIATNRDEMELAAESSRCHDELKRHPDVAQLDRCAAFDDAVVELQDRDPLRDRGPFGELAVTGRQWSGASSLSRDYLAIDGRLDRVRLRVELALAPSDPDSAPVSADRPPPALPARRPGPPRR
ncbi:MAG: J domain-containing protein [Sphingomicrobium sp.]